MWRVFQESRQQTEVAWLWGVGGEDAGMEDTKKVTDGMAAESTRAEMGTSLFTAVSLMPRTVAGT